MGCSSSKTLQEDVQMQEWINSVERSFTYGASMPKTPNAADKRTTVYTLQTVDNSLKQIDSHERRDLRSLLHRDTPPLSADDDYTDAPSDLTCEELSEANSEKQANTISKVSLQVRNFTLEPKKSNVLNMPNAKQDLNEYITLAYADYRQSPRRLQNATQDTPYVKQRNGSRFTLEDVLTFPSRLNSTVSARKSSDKDSTTLSGEKFRVQSMKLYKEKSVLPSAHVRRFKSRKERKAKVVDVTKTGCFPTRKSSVDSSENIRNGLKALPKQPESNRSTSMKGLFYGASLTDDLKQEFQTDQTSRKISQHDSSNLEQFKALDHEYLTFFPADFQGNGSARYHSNSFDTAEEQFSGDDFSQESENVSVSSPSGAYSPVKRKALIADQNCSVPSRTISNSTTETSSSNANFNKIINKDQQQTEGSLEHFECLCPPGGNEQVVLYTTSLRGIRKTYEECSTVRMVLQGFCVKIDERDISMHSGFKQELKDLLPNAAHVPRLFIKGRHIGGAREVVQLNETGFLVQLLETLPKYTHRELCKGCGEVLFVPCPDCAGSCKIVREGNKVVQCPFCNENGIIRCPICC